ncbi:hypothetical protein FRC03_011763 [Tulasnella sp. 419]|nr:hypothetical protein FRC03_011763 [Tulasnella sp. 419]
MEMIQSFNQGAIAKCLAVPELITLIFEYLSPHDTYSAAQVCRLWADFAVPTLWQSHPVPLVALLSLLNSEGVDNQHLLTAMFIWSPLNNPDQVTASQWERFIWFSGLVRKLEIIANGTGYNLVHHLPKLLARYGGHLLPNVKAITVSSRLMLPFITNFLSNSLRSLVITKSNDFSSRCHPQDCHNILSKLEKQASHLQEVSLNGFSGEFAFSNFDSFIHLTTLRLAGQIKAGTLHSIIRCTRLCRLSLVDISVSSTSNENISYCMPPNLTFPNLESLELGLIVVHTEGVGFDMDDMLDKLECPNVTHVTIHQPSSFKERLPRWIQKLSKDSPKLTQVTIATFSILKRQDLQPLAILPNLKHLKIVDGRYGGENILPRVVLEECLSALPDLQVFEWVPDAEDESILQWESSTEHVDIEAVPDLLRRCPNLSGVTLLLSGNRIKAKLRRIVATAQDSQQQLKRRAPLRSLHLIVPNLDPADIQLLARVMVGYVSSSTELSILASILGTGGSQNPLSRWAHKRNKIYSHEFAEHVARLRAERRYE